jgi:hypothetical protein
MKLYKTIYNLNKVVTLQVKQPAKGPESHDVRVDVAF